MCKAINEKTLDKLASKQLSVPLDFSLKENLETWKDRMFAINISFNGTTNIFSSKILSEEGIQAEVSMRILFSL